MEKSRNLIWMTLGYVICSFLAFILLGVSPQLSQFLLLFGANSVFAAFGVFGAAAVSQFWGICAFLWLVSFPVALIAVFIAAMKKHYLPFWILMVIDVAAVFVWIVYAMFDHNLYGAQIMLPDLAVSVIFTYLYKTQMRP